MRNSDRQPVPNRFALISSPAIAGPTTTDKPMAGPSAANALPICAGGKMSRIRPNACGTSNAADSPCNTRAPISDCPDQAHAHAADATRNPARPTSNIRLRPNMSPSRPPVISPTANASVYPAAIHSSCAALNFRSRWIDGPPMFTIVESRMLRISAASTTENRSHAPSPARGAGVVGGSRTDVHRRLLRVA